MDLGPLPTTTPRLSRPASRISPSPLPLSVRSVIERAVSIGRAALSAFLALPPLQRAVVAVLLLVAVSLSVLLLVFSHALFATLGPIAKGWRATTGGWIPIWLMVFMTAFPPLVGYSFCNTLAGFVFGFPGGWPLVASAAVAGSLVAFLASRTVLSSYVARLVGKDPRFLALGQVLRTDGLVVLTMIRFCPLPFSLSNGFLATIPSVTPWAFAASTALSSPKLFVHVFLGSRLALLAEHGDTMTARDKIINYLSMIVSAAVGIGVGWVVYRRTMARAAEIAKQNGQATVSNDPATTTTASAGPPDNQDYADLESGLLDPEDAAALMDDDAISLWEAGELTYVGEARNGRYKG